MKSKTSSGPFAVARTLDILFYEVGKKSLMGAGPIPQVSQGQGDLCEKRNVNADVLSWHFPLLCSLDGRDHQWAAKTICTFFRAYFRSLSVHFPQMEVGSCVDLSCGRYISSLKELVVLLKDICTSPLSLLTGLPQDRFAWACPLFGAPQKFLKKALKRRNGRALNFANDCLQFKNSCPKVPDWFVESNLEGHKERVLMEERHSARFKELVLRSAEELLVKCRAFGFFSLEKDREVVDISTRSTVESSMKSRGGYGYYNEFEGDYDRNGNFRPLVRHYSHSPSGVATYIGRMLPLEGQLLDEFRGILEEGPPIRKVVGLTEPLKVRTITMHHASETNLWSRWQKEMAHKLLRLPMMASGRSKLTNFGVPVDFIDSDFDAMEEAMSHQRSQGYDPVIVSDDASAATDSIHPSLSREIGDMTWKNDGLGRKEFFDSWQGTLIYPDGSEVNQLNGQLMGDRRSFPLLCLIHMAAKLSFLKIHNLERRSFFRVNGDDGVIIIPKHLVEEYFEFMGELWKINRAKTYVDAKIFSFNSKLWVLPSRRQVAISRFKIVDGIDKNGDKSSDPRLWNRIYDDCPDYARAALWEYFCANPIWNKKLKEASVRGVNWFIPNRGGGLGLHAIGEYFTTPLQRTWVIEALAGKDVAVKFPTARTWISKPHVITYPKMVVHGVKNESSPTVRVTKPFTCPGPPRFPRKPRYRTWRDVSYEIVCLETQATHYCVIGEECWCRTPEYNFIPGESIEYCESYLHNRDVQEE